MAGGRKPIGACTGKHWTKAERELREAQEIHAPADKVKPPQWLTKEEKKRFKFLAAQLISLKVMSNLDIVSLAMLVRVEQELIGKNDEIAAWAQTLPDAKERERSWNERRDLWKQYNKACSEFGLTPVARCRIAAPMEESKEENRFLQFAKGKQA